MKALTTKINEYKRKIAKAEDELAVIQKKGIQPYILEQDANMLFFRAKWKQERINRLKAELCDLLLERVSVLEAEVQRYSKEYEVGGQ